LIQKGLITQRSLIQIQPPQPTKSRGCRAVFQAGAALVRLVELDEVGAGLVVGSSGSRPRAPTAPCSSGPQLGNGTTTRRAPAWRNATRRPRMSACSPISATPSVTPWARCILRASQRAAFDRGPLAARSTSLDFTQEVARVIGCLYDHVWSEPTKKLAPASAVAASGCRLLRSAENATATNTGLSRVAGHHRCGRRGFLNARSRKSAAQRRRPRRRFEAFLNHSIPERSRSARLHRCAGWIGRMRDGSRNCRRTAALSSSRSTSRLTRRPMA
jgi:hypothetical protein